MYYRKAYRRKPNIQGAKPLICIIIACRASFNIWIFASGLCLICLSITCGWYLFCLSITSRGREVACQAMMGCMWVYIIYNYDNCNIPYNINSPLTFIRRILQIRLQAEMGLLRYWKGKCILISIWGERSMTAILPHRPKNGVGLWGHRCCEHWNCGGMFPSIIYKLNPFLQGCRLLIFLLRILKRVQSILTWFVL